MMKQKILKAMAFDVTGSTIRKLVFFGSSIIVARTLGPTLLGKYMIIIGFCGTLGSIVNMGTNAAFIRYFGELSGVGQTKWVGRLIKDVIAIRLVWYILIGALVTTFVHPIFSLLGLVYDPYTLGFILVYVLLHTTYSLFETYLQTQFQQKYTNIIEGVAAFFHLGFIAYLFSVHNLDVRTLLLVIISILAGKVLLFARKSVSVSRVRAKQDATKERDPAFYSDLKKRFIKYSLTMFAIGLGGMILAYRSDIYFLSFYLGLAAVGYYNLVNNFIDSAYNLVLPRSIGTMYSSAMVEAYKRTGDMSVLNKYFRKQVEFILLTTIPLAVGGSILSAPIIEFFYGEQYLPAVPLFVIFFLITSILKCGGAVASVFVTLEKPHYFMWTKILSIINIPLNIVLIQSYGIMGALYATSATLSLILFVEYMLARRLAQVRLPIKTIVKIITASAIMGVVVYWMKHLLAFDIVLSLGIPTIFGGLVYLFFVYYGNIVEREYISFFLGKIKNF